METLRYDYKPRAWKMALGGLFFAVCGAALGHTAARNDRGVVIDGLIRLGPGGATLFYWVLFGVSVLFVIGALLGLVRSLAEAREVVLDAHTLSAPKSGLGSTIVVVPLSSIRGVEIKQLKSQCFIVIDHVAGKLTINGSMMPSRDDFETLAMEIPARVRMLKAR